MSWKTIDQDRYWDQLEVLPPAVMTALGFMVGEAYDHNAQGIPRFRAFVKISGGYFEAEQPMTITEFNRLKQEDILENHHNG